MKETLEPVLEKKNIMIKFCLFLAHLSRQAHKVSL